MIGELATDDHGPLLAPAKVDGIPSKPLPAAPVWIPSRGDVENWL
jgi:predicted component of type VI protein secretion system